MAPPITLTLTSRSKKPIKKLPATIDVPHDASVEEIKILIARETGCDDFNRIGLFDPTTNKTLKNRRALISEEAGVLSKKQLLVKDLGRPLTLTTPPLFGTAPPLATASLTRWQPRPPGRMAHRLRH